VDFDAFIASLDAADAPPAGLGRALGALWVDARGDWEQAHRLAQSARGADGAWVHAYLHRKEGDLANASYWYRRAGRAVSGAALGDEWAEIVRALLAGARA
jgi:hypothetical protein